MCQYREAQELQNILFFICLIKSTFSRLSAPWQAPKTARSFKHSFSESINCMLGAYRESFGPGEGKVSWRGASNHPRCPQPHGIRAAVEAFFFLRSSPLLSQCVKPLPHAYLDRHSRGLLIRDGISSVYVKQSPMAFQIPFEQHAQISPQPSPDLLAVLQQMSCESWS